ncbi:unnamed protein product [Closterium sp. NIES-54]
MLPHLFVLVMSPVLVLLLSQAFTRIVLPEPLASSLPHVPDPESDLARAASPTVTRLLATVITDPDFESTAAFALVTELVDFAARSHLDYVVSLVTESEYVCPPSVRGEPALSSDVLEDKQFEFECLAAVLPHFASMLLCPEGDPDALDIPTPRSYAEAIAGTYVDEVPPPGANIVDGMWIFRVKRPPGSPPAFKTRYVARGFTLGFALSSADPLLFLRTETTMPPFYVLVYVDDLVFATSDTEALSLVKAELQERHTCTDLGPSALRLLVLLTTAHSSVYWPLALSSTFENSVEPSGPYPELVGCLMYLMTCTRPDLAYPLSLLARYVAPGHGASAWRTHCEAEIYAGAMAAQELRWLTYLLTDLGERPRSPPFLYVDSKAMLALYVLSTVDVGAASASAKRRSSKGKGGRGGGGGSGSGGGGSSGGSGGSGGGGSGGSGGGSGGVGGGGGGSGGSGGSGSGDSGGGRTGAQRGGSGGGQWQWQQRRSETPSP